MHERQPAAGCGAVRLSDPARRSGRHIDALRRWDDKSATILDWEMAHRGDPLKDLAWTLLWSTPHDIVGGLLNHAEYIAAYQAASGDAVDAARLAYWEIFACVKLAAIFIAGVRPRSDAHARRQKNNTPYDGCPGSRCLPGR